MTLGTDPRADRRMVAVMAELGLDGHGEPTPVNADTPIEGLYAYCNEAEAGLPDDVRRALCGPAAD